MKDEQEEYNDNNSSGGQVGESNRSSNNSTGWLDTNRGRGRTQQQKIYGNASKKSNKTKEKVTKMGMMNGGGDYDTDDEWRAAGSTSSLGLASTKRQIQSRSRSRKAKKKDEVIEILDSSSEEEAMTPGGKQSKVSSATEQHLQFVTCKYVSSYLFHSIFQPKSKRPTISDLFTIEAARIAVGKKVFKSKCELQFQFRAKDQYMKFCWNNKGKEGSHTVSLKQDSDLRGLHYYVAQEDDDNSESILTDRVDYLMTMIAFKIKATVSNGFTKYTNSFNDDSFVAVEFRDNDQFLVRRPCVLCV